MSAYSEYYSHLVDKMFVLLFLMNRESSITLFLLLKNNCMLLLLFQYNHYTLFYLKPFMPFVIMIPLRAAWSWVIVLVFVFVRKIHMCTVDVQCSCFSVTHARGDTHSVCPLASYGCSVLFHDSLPAVLPLLKGKEATVWELFVCVAAS